MESRAEVRVDEVLYRSGNDPFEPTWVIGVSDDGQSYLLYDVRHLIPARVGMRAIIERRRGKWVLVQEVEGDR